MTPVLWFALLGVVLPAAFVALAFASPRRRQVERWARATGVVLTSTNEAVVRARLGRSRRIRSLVALPFWSLGFAPLLDPDLSHTVPVSLAGVAAYLVGAMVAELTVPPAPATGVRQAPLVPRNLGDYAPSWVTPLPWMVTALAGLATTLSVAAGRPSSAVSEAVVLLVLAVAMSALGSVATRRIVARPQVGADPDALAADDALRATGVGVCTAGSTAAAVTAFGVSVSVLADGAGGWTIVLLPVTMLLIGIQFALVSMVVRQESWAHRRRFRQRPVLVPAQ